MQRLNQTKFALSTREVGLLARNVPNEIINGFEVKEFEKSIGATETQAKAIFIDLRGASKRGNVVLDHSQAVIVRNALGAVIEELGIAEFQTRTGHEFEEGLATLRRLDSFLHENMAEVRS